MRKQRKNYQPTVESLMKRSLEESISNVCYGSFSPRCTPPQILYCLNTSSHKAKIEKSNHEIKS